jgi:23S rRNA pseudouridine2605 synthase
LAKKKSQDDLKESSLMRIQKALAQLGVGSRRGIEKAITENRIEVNNAPAHIGQTVSSKDKIVFDGKLIRLSDETLLPKILLYHKPDGEIVSKSDPKNRPSVFDHLPRLKKEKWIAIGRLDFNTSGLLIFTTYGALANRLMHPRYEIEREYSVRVLGELTEIQMRQLTEGVLLDDGQARLESIIFEGGEGANHWYKVTIREGRNREVRRLFEKLNFTVSRLIRVRFGQIKLPSHLKRGMHLELTQKHVKEVLKEHNFELNQFKTPQITNKKKSKKNYPF